MSLHLKPLVCKLLEKVWCSDHGQSSFDNHLNGAVLHRPDRHPAEKPLFCLDPVGDSGSDHLFFTQSPAPLSPQRTHKRQRILFTFSHGKNTSYRKMVLPEIKIKHSGGSLSKKEGCQEKATFFPGYRRKKREISFPGQKRRQTPASLKLD